MWASYFSIHFVFFLGFLTFRLISHPFDQATLFLGLGLAVGELERCFFFILMFLFYVLAKIHTDNLLPVHIIMLILL